MIYFTAHTFNCVCHCIRAMFRVLGMYNFAEKFNSMNLFNISLCCDMGIVIFDLHGYGGCLRAKIL